MTWPSRLSAVTSLPAALVPQAPRGHSTPLTPTSFLEHGRCSTKALIRYKDMSCFEPLVPCELPASGQGAENLAFLKFLSLGSFCPCSFVLATAFETLGDSAASRSNTPYLQVWSSCSSF